MHARELLGYQVWESEYNSLFFSYFGIEVVACLELESSTFPAHLFTIELYDYDIMQLLSRIQQRLLRKYHFPYFRHYVL